MDLPEDIFEEARLVLQRIESTDTGIMPVSEQDSETTGGVVAEILNMVALETAQLSIPPPEVCCFALLLASISEHRL